MSRGAVFTAIDSLAGWRLHWGWPSQARWPMQQVFSSGFLIGGIIEAAMSIGLRAIPVVMDARNTTTRMGLRRCYGTDIVAGQTRYAPSSASKRRR